MKSIEASRTFGKFLVVAALLGSIVGVDATEVIPPMHMQLVPEVRQQIERLPTQEQIRINKAMNVANRFLTMRFAGQDWVQPSVREDSERWYRLLGPLMAMDDDEWWSISMQAGWGEYSYPDSRHDLFTLISCNTAKVLKLQPLNGGYAVAYQTHLLGIDPHSFNEDFQEHYPGESATYELTVILNSDLKVQGLRTPNKTVAVNVMYRLKRNKDSIQLQGPKWQQRATEQYNTLKSVAKRCDSIQ